MFQPLSFLGALNGVCHFILNGSRAQKGAPPLVEEPKVPSVEESGRTKFAMDERAIHRLMFRAELEMADPNAVRRRDTISQLKLAAASTRQDAPPPA